MEVMSMTIILCFFTLIMFIANSHAVTEGAANGLLLWYRNVVPVLLPFMLISSIMVSGLRKMSNTGECSDKRASLYGVLTTLFLGVFCGYPLGAGTAADMVRHGTYTRLTGTILIPLCNNSSPMFIAGYIIHTLLDSSVSLGSALAVIYIPYILAASASVLFCRSLKLFCPPYSRRAEAESAAAIQDTDYIIKSVVQITYVGIYIMLCSIIISFLAAMPLFNATEVAILSGITEITSGTYSIACLDILSAKTKTALILACTSFGGISSILQTNKVINNSGLSLLYYISVKTICAIGTFAISYMML